ncbi:7-cyano-7-deazaguanine synthase [Streptomyces sp. NPDC093568]|uniref:7-cyano-7-deazaguanine synthase n=1 Tax=Streptomyces sp. NPDC093568 TaxID=3366041 RepID=UPI00380CFA8B
MTLAPGPLHFWWRSYDTQSPEGSEWRSIGASGIQEREERLTGHHLLYGPVPAWADDLLRISRAVFLADKLADRSDSEDRWTREFRLSVPVSDPDLWALAASGPLPALLQTLTADVWDVSLRRMRAAPEQGSIPVGEDWRSHEVALFSGGLDSLSWAATRASVPGDGVLLLVTYAEKNVEDVQREAYAAVKALAEQSGRQLRQITFGQTSGGQDGTVVERTSRPRGLLYASTAVRVAAADGVATVQVPENGQLALNPPLSAARSAALSTRSVHPRTLHLLNTVIESVGGRVRVENPLASLTKGEVCRAALTAGLSEASLAQTLSCGAPPQRRRGLPHVNCGTCYPCLIRRAGLLSAAGSDATPYETAPWLPGLSEDRIRHWLALQGWLAWEYSALDLIGDLPLPQRSRTGEWLSVVQRGRVELRALVESASGVREVA